MDENKVLQKVVAWLVEQEEIGEDFALMLEYGYLVLDLDIPKYIHDACFD